MGGKPTVGGAFLMSIDRGKIAKYQEQYPQIMDCIGQSKTVHDALPSYIFLRDLRPEIPKELYAFYFRKLLQMSTANVSIELRLEMFEGITPEDIMYQDELDAIDKTFDEYITVYRGTSKNEDVPGLSWTLRKYIAEGTFYEGRLFEARIPKSSILLYFAHEEDEGEIISHVTSGYKIIEED